MITKQKGFLFAIFGGSIILSVLLIASFMAFVFKFGFAQNNEFTHSSNYDLVSHIKSYCVNTATWITPGWSGKFSLGSIYSMLSDETMWYRNVTSLQYDYTIGLITSSYRNNMVNMSYINPEKLMK